MHVVPLIVLSNWHGAPEPGTRCSIGPTGRKELISLVACVKRHTAEAKDESSPRAQIPYGPSCAKSRKRSNNEMSLSMTHCFCSWGLSAGVEPILSIVVAHVFRISFRRT